MSLVDSDKIVDSESVNVEDVLATFFLKRLNMKDTKTYSDGKYKKKSKHKKHKSKKHKHKSSRRSSSLERTEYQNTLDIGRASSSEEKDIKRLKKIKKLDANDSKKINSYLPISLSAQHVLPLNPNSSQSNSSACVEIGIPYGPSLELLLTGTEKDKETESQVLSDISTSNQDNKSLDGVITKSNEISKCETSNSTTKSNCLEFGSLKLAETPSINELIKSNDLISTKDCINSLSKSEIFATSKDVAEINNLSVNSATSKTELSHKNENNKKIKRSRSRSKSKSHCRNVRSRSKSKKHSTRSRSRHRSHSRSRSKSKKCLTRSRSQHRSHSRSRSKSKRRSIRSRSRYRSHSRSRRSRSSQRTRKRRSYSRSRSKSRHPSSSKHRSRSRSKETSRKGRSHRSRSISRSRKYRRSYSRDDSRSRRYSRQSQSKDRRHHSRSYSKERPSQRSKRESSYSSKSYTKKSSEIKTSTKRKSRSKSIDKESSSKSCKIDQAKILEIAQKNVLNMIEQGTLPEGLSLDQFKKKELLSLKSGGKSVQELTEFCAKLSKKEHETDGETGTTTEVSTAEGDTGFIHHPFKLKEQSMIKLNIKNAVQIPVKTHAEKFAETAKLSSQFPVSSGNQHKQKELEWIPVVPDKNKSDLKTNETKTAVSSTPVIPKPEIASPKAVESPATVAISAPVTNSLSFIPLPAPSTLPSSFTPLPPPPLPPTIPSISSPVVSENVSFQPRVTLPVTYNTPFPAINYPTLTVNQTLPCVNTFPIIASGPIPSTSSGELFIQPSMPSSEKRFDITTMFSKKFQAQQKLQEDPSDAEALKTIQEMQASIQEWVQSCEVPGMFYGGTLVKPLTREELSGPRDYRIKRDTFTRAAPVTEGKGMSLLKKMGWNPGEGLGKNKEGSLVPLIIDIKMDKKGLVSEGESGETNISNAVKELQGKHPVSALMELCSKRKWKPPLYSVVKDIGPPHKKLFLFKVEVNGVDYQPIMPSSNKKVAKADAAIVCLQSLKVFPT